MPALDMYEQPQTDPLDAMEQLAQTREWAFDRRSELEMAVEVPGRWCDFGLFVAHAEEMGALHISCTYDMRVPSGRLGPVYELLAQANERLWLGAFVLWSEERYPMIRQVILGGQDGRYAVDRLEEVVDIMLAEAERFYPAFQYVIWGGKAPLEALEAAMLDTVGEA